MYRFLAVVCFTIFFAKRCNRKMRNDPISMLIETRTTVILLSTSHKTGKGAIATAPLVCRSVQYMWLSEKQSNFELWPLTKCWPLIRKHIWAGRSAYLRWRMMILKVVQCHSDGLPLIFSVHARGRHPSVFATGSFNEVVTPLGSLRHRCCIISPTLRTFDCCFFE